MNKRSWNHGGKTRQQRGYGADHDRMRDHLMQTVVLCEHCRAKGRTTIGSHADHIIPKAQGGGNERENYQLLCADCHADKTIREKGGTPKRKRTYGLDGWPV